MKLYRLLDEAISNKLIISFTYDELFRIVEPHHYGMLNGSEQLHAYQITGETHSGGIPEWRNFILEKIHKLKILDVNFTPRTSYNPSNSNYQIIITKISE